MDKKIDTKLESFLADLFENEGAEGVVNCLSFLFGSFLITKDGIIIGASDGLLDLLGFDRLELYGMKASDLITADEQATTRTHFESSDESCHELNLMTKSGCIKTALAYPKVLQFRDGIYRLTEFIDISSRTEATLKLQEREKKFRSVFELAAIGIGCLKPDGTWLETNQKLCDIVGYSENELLQLTFQDITHPEDLSKDLNYVEQLLRGASQSYSMEKRYFHKQGHIIWANLTASLVRDSNNEPQYFVSLVEDITELKLARDKLKLSDEILSATTDMMAQVDQDNIYVAANGAYLKAFGLTETALIGCSIPELYGSDFYDNVIRPQAEQLKSGKPIHYQDWFQFPETGSKYMDVAYTLRSQDKENYSGFVISARDITVLKIAQDQLTENERRFRAMMESLPLAIYVSTGKDQVCQYINKTFTEFFGYTIEEVPCAAQWWLKAYPEKDYRDAVSLDWQSRIETAIATKTSIQQTDSVITCRDGTKKIVRWGYISLDELNYAFGLDVTAIKEAEAELIHLNEQLEHLSFFDALTNISNRRLFDLSLEKEWIRARRHRVPLALIMLDIDLFKLYNDHYGHLKGDECLALVAQTLKNTLNRGDDMVARFGGEEFVILLPDTTLERARGIAEKCRNAIIDKQIAHAACPIGDVLSISLGVASVIPDTDTPALSLVNSADKMLYRAKENGRNRTEP